MIKVEFEELHVIDDNILKYVVIAAIHEDKWVFVQHKDRTSWELPGGHIELGELPIDAAHRELNEETGAVNFDIYPVCDYNVISTVNRDDASWGRLYVSKVYKFGELPDLEIGEVRMSHTCPGKWTYEQIQPFLQIKIDEWLKSNDIIGG